MKPLLIVSLLALAAAGCSEAEQTASGIKTDTAPFNGTNKQPPYTASGWKPGDRANWEQALKVRTVNGQNDYVKVP